MERITICTIMPLDKLLKFGQSLQFIYFTACDKEYLIMGSVVNTTSYPNGEVPRQTPLLFSIIRNKGTCLFLIKPVQGNQNFLDLRTMEHPWLMHPVGASVRLYFLTVLLMPKPCTYARA